MNLSSNNKEKLTHNHPEHQNKYFTIMQLSVCQQNHKVTQCSVYQHCVIIASENNYKDPHLREYIITFKEHITQSYILTLTNQKGKLQRMQWPIGINQSNTMRRLRNGTEWHCSSDNNQHSINNQSQVLYCQFN